ncbi:DUF4118 domain-containing protein [Ktedonosporobacter rubrisoli]|uniref:DUF4118 domain-containing protein n=1 Tax=Ktedonosporobacter rubrisoli TaxID=2509675 RepID=A0A4P6JRD4_KTERU|nr:DUF4118 domain-containing protein [Ktedonosporobacter rubrisoli]QBD77853.1 DUF4118 domain-containing protein [Ktedonosporobacter rubrisoli]
MLSTDHLPPLEVRREARWQRYLNDSLLAVVGSLLITGIIRGLRLYPFIPNISFAYLLIVLALASTRGLYAAILASIVAFFSFDFFLVPPLFTFSVGTIEEWLALFFFLAVAIITGQLAAALRQRAAEANRKERETRILYELVRATNIEEDPQRLLHIVACSIVDVFTSWGVQDCAILLPDERGKLKLQASAVQPIDQLQISSDEQATATWVMAQGKATELYDVSLKQQKTPGFSPAQSCAIRRPNSLYGAISVCYHSKQARKSWASSISLLKTIFAIFMYLTPWELSRNSPTPR